MIKAPSRPGEALFGTVMNNDTSTKTTRKPLARTIGERVLVLDGSMGTMLRMYGKQGLPDIACLSDPGLVASIHRLYLEAGADIVETDTFGSNSITLEAYGLGRHAADINLAGAATAREMADRYTAADPSRPRYVAGAIGPAVPHTSTPGDTGVTAARLIDAYAAQARALIQGGVDVLLLETVFDLGSAEAAIEGIALANMAEGTAVPHMISLTVDGASGRLPSGHTIRDAAETLAGSGPLALGLNCSCGPENLAEATAALAAYSPFPVICYPNAGLPDKSGKYAVTPRQFADSLRPLIESRTLAIAGGCCGTTPAHIRALADMVRGS